MTAVAVVLVNWNGAEWLRPCLQAVAAQQGGAPPAIVVDNGSTDGSPELLQREFPQVTLLRNAVNNYAAANNLGFARAQADYVLQLNTDTQIAPDCVPRLAAALDARRDAAAVMPKIVFPDGRLQSTGVLERDDLYWVDRDLGAPNDGRRDEPEDLFGVSGCCALHRRAVWQRLGGLDETFHMYYEDVDYSLRARAAGHALLYEPRTRCVHAGGGSIRKTASGKDPLGERNRLLVLAAHYAQRFAAECVRSPWFQSAPPAELRALLPLLARRLPGGEDALADLLLALRDAVREHAGELDAAWGTHRNFPRILVERERWIARLLRELRWLRFWRVPGFGLKAGEQEFLRRQAASGGAPPPTGGEPR
jgi:hypothetical protein